MSHGRSCTVFIGNIPYDATEEDLRGIFSRAGSIDSLRLVYDKDTKQPKGYAFCDYSDAETALSAIRTLNDAECNGRRLRIDLADNALRSPMQKGGGQAMPLALPAPEPRARPISTPTAYPSLPAAPPPGPAPLCPPMPPGVVPLRPPGPPGQPDATTVCDASVGIGTSPEAVIAAVCAHAEIAQTVASMSQAQLQLCLDSTKRLAVEAPEKARAFLQDSPQLCYALLHMQLLLGLSSDPLLPATDEEIQRLRAEATHHRPFPLVNSSGAGAASGIVVPPNLPGCLGGPPRPAVVGPVLAASRQHLAGTLGLHGPQTPGPCRVPPLAIGVQLVGAPCSHAPFGGAPLPPPAAAPAFDPCLAPQASAAARPPQGMFNSQPLLVGSTPTGEASDGSAAMASRTRTTWPGMNGSRRGEESRSRSRDAGTRPIGS